MLIVSLNCNLFHRETDAFLYCCDFSPCAIQLVNVSISTVILLGMNVHSIYYIKAILTNITWIKKKKLYKFLLKLAVVYLQLLWPFEYYCVKCVMDC